MIRSFRVRLLFWNAVILTLAMSGFGLALIYLNQARMAAAIDRELHDRVTRASRTGPMPPQPAGLMPPGAERPPPPMMSGPGPMLPDLRRPRFFGPNGEAMGRQLDDEPFDPAALARALNGERHYSTVPYEGLRLRVLTAPLRTSAGAEGAVQAVRELNDLEALKGEQLRTLLLFLPLALGIALSGSYWLTNRALRPVAEVTQSAAAITESDLSRRLEVRGDDEMARLSSTYNEMLGRLEAAFASQRDAYRQLADAFDNQRRFTADASHELRTPLTRLRLATGSGLAPDATEEERARALQVADQSGRLMANLVQQLLTLSRADAGQLGLRLEPVDLRLPVSQAIEQVSPAPAALEVDMASNALIVEADELHLQRVVVNLLENAIRYTPPNGTIRVRVARVSEEAVVEVSDTGEGIAPEHLEEIFERFFRVDSARNSEEGGTGLGLSICKSIVEAHGGRILAESEIGRGTTFRVLLPISKFK